MVPLPFFVRTQSTFKNIMCINKHNAILYEYVQHIRFICIIFIYVIDKLIYIVSNICYIGVTVEKSLKENVCNIDN